MIKQTMATALFSWIVIALIGIPTSKAANSDSTIFSGAKKNKSQFYLQDTIFVPQFAENSTIFQQNLIYKLRLDSVQHSVPLTYNEHVQKYIDIYLGRKEQMGKMLGLSKYYFPIFEKNLKEAGIPEEIKFISIIESNLDPHAVSRSGAVGPWQFMYTTAKGYGLKMDNFVDERKDPLQASSAAAVYFKDAYSKLGDWLLAIAAYNCGTGAVTRAIARSGGNTDFWSIRQYLPKETQNYVPAFIATVYVMNYYLKHDIYPIETDFNIFTDVIDVNKVLSLSSIAKAGNLDLRELSILNPSYKKQIINGSINSPKRLVIPAVDNGLYASLYNLLGSSDNLTDEQVIPANLSTQTSHQSVTAYHKVEPNESLLLIANRYNVEIQDLKVWNKLQSDVLVSGQNLKISSGQNQSKAQKSPSRYFTYKVRLGDTLSSIAGKFGGVTVSTIKSINGLKGSFVKAGMLLRILKV